MTQSENTRLYKMIGIGCICSIPIVFFLYLQDDVGLFLPRTVWLDRQIPESLVYLRSEYELRLDEMTIFVWIIFYLLVLGIINLFFWKNDHQRYFRIGHFILTIGLILIFSWTMIEDDIFHELKIRNPIGQVQYESKVRNFYILLIVWTLFQVIYWITFMVDKLSDMRKC